MKYYREDAFCNKLRFSLNCPKFSFDDRSLITHSILGRKFREDHVGPTDIRCVEETGIAEAIRANVHNF